MAIKINDKYKSLINENTRYYIITGGRGSGKSFVVSLYLVIKLLLKGVRILFTRFTLSSAKDSIIPEFNEKLELLNISEQFDVQSRDIQCIDSKSDILFRGIKTGSKIQTANLKSLTGVNVWVVDEAEELVDETIFNKINLSIRDKKGKNIIILVLNPSYRSHWIYKKFFEDAKVPELFNGIKGNVTYIHTDYTDNIENLDPELLAEIEELKIKDKARFEHEILGHWLDEPEGIVFPKHKLKRFKREDLNQVADANVSFTDVADQGTDHLSTPFAAIHGNNAFITDVIFTRDGESITNPRLREKFNKYKTEKAVFESNNMGHLFSANIEKQIDSDYHAFKTEIIPVPSKGHKVTRIISNADWILEHCHFLAESEYEIGSEYWEFIKFLTKYNKEDGLSQSDDAPDSMAGLARLLRIEYLL